jgi:hypothetical protein
MAFFISYPLSTLLYTIYETGADKGYDMKKMTCYDVFIIYFNRGNGLGARKPKSLNRRSKIG